MDCHQCHYPFSGNETECPICGAVVASAPPPAGTTPPVAATPAADPDDTDPPPSRWSRMGTFITEHTSGSMDKIRIGVAVICFCCLLMGIAKHWVAFETFPIVGLFFVFPFDLKILRFMRWVVAAGWIFISVAIVLR